MAIWRTRLRNQRLEDIPDSEVENSALTPGALHPGPCRVLPPHRPIVHRRPRAPNGVVATCRTPFVVSVLTGVGRRVQVSNLPAPGVLAVAVQFRHRSRARAVVPAVLAARLRETIAALVGAFAIRMLLCHGVLLRRAEPTCSVTPCNRRTSDGLGRSRPLGSVPGLTRIPVRYC
jgi:hypothetical protein